MKSILKIKQTNLLNTTILQVLLLMLTLSCNSQEREVTLKLDAKSISNINKVAVRGDIKPLSQNKDFIMNDQDGDGIYETTIKFKTSKRNVNFKFIVNGEFELQGSDARRIWFKNQPVIGEYVFNEFNFYNKTQISKLSYTDAEIDEDLAILKKIVQYVHPNIYRYRDSIDLQGDFKMLEAEMKGNPTLTNIYGAVSKFAAKIKCSHTFTNPWNQGGNMEKANFYLQDKIPFTFNRIGKQIFIDKNASENKKLKKGLEILEINGITTEEILMRLSDYVTSDGNNFEKKLERLSVSGEEKFAMFDIFFPIEFDSKDKFALKLKDHNSKEEFEAIVKATSKTNRTKTLIDRYGELDTSLKDGWSFEMLEDNIAKLTIKSFAVQRNEFDWKEYLDKVFEQLNQKSVSNFIIDIRGNEGGQGEVGEYILERVIEKPFKVNAMKSSVRYLEIPKEFEKYMHTWDRFPYDFNGKIAKEENGRYYLKEKYSLAETIMKPKKKGYKGKVYLMTDASNSSATHLMAMYAKQIENITLVGQETGGNMLGTNGSFMFFLRLPNTKVELDIPVINMLVPTNDIAVDGGVKPHLEIKKNVQDFINNVDTELNAVINLIK